MHAAPARHEGVCQLVDQHRDEEEERDENGDDPARHVREVATDAHPADAGER